MQFKSSFLSMTHKAFCDLTPADLSATPAFLQIPFLHSRHSKLLSIQNKAWSLTPPSCSCYLELPSSVTAWLAKSSFITPYSVKPFLAVQSRLSVSITFCWVSPFMDFRCRVIYSPQLEHTYYHCLCKTLLLFSLFQSLISTPITLPRVNMYHKHTNTLKYVSLENVIVFKFIQM